MIFQNNSFRYHFVLFNYYINNFIFKQAEPFARALHF